MRKTLVQCCIALLMAPSLVCMLLGTVALASAPGGSGTGTGSSTTTPGGSGGGSGSGSSTTPLAPTRYLRVEAVDSATHELKFGAEKRLAVKVYTKLGDDGKEREVTQDATYFWESSNDKVIRLPIDTVGGIRAVGTGTAQITVEATYGGKTEELTFTVTVVDDIRVIVTERTAAVETVYATVEESKELYAYISKNGKQESGTITWRSGDSSVVEVSQNTDGSVATLKPRQEGTSIITASAAGAESAQVTCIVKPKPSTDPDDPGTSDPDTTLPKGAKVTGIRITSPVPGGTDGKYIMSPGSETIQASISITDPDGNPFSKEIVWNRSGKAVATFVISGKPYEVEAVFESDDRDVVNVSSGKITAGSAGVAKITARAGNETAGSVEDELTVEVSGFKLLKEKVTLEENQGVDLIEEEILQAYGNADLNSLSIWSDNTTVATYENGKIIGRNPGKTTFTVSANKGAWRDTFEVEVHADPNATIPAEGTITIKNTDTLPFTDRRLTFRNQAGGSLSHITGLNVDASQGTLYYNYRSESQPGTGVGAGSYYLEPKSGQNDLHNITFIPKTNFAGQATIYYTAVSTSGQNYACRILLTVTTQSGSDASINLSTPYNTPIKFTGTEFNRVCRERLGGQLSYVVFSQPPERQGKLYTNYSGSGNYGSVVDTRKQYSLRELDDVWFVPAPGYSGSVTVYYTAYAVGVNRGSYSGQVNITVGQEGGVSIGGLAYDIAMGGVVHFDDEDFNDYCQEVLYEESRYDRQTLSFIRFTALPTEGEGVLYYDYRSSTNTGSRALTGTSYYYGIRNPRIDRLTFVPAPNFSGTIKIPFTGWTTDGTSFSGNVEVNVRSGTSSGDIYYTCAPGRSVSFRSNDFTSLSNRLTGRTIDYIVFQNLPNSADGSLYYGTSRITTTGTQYRNSNLSRLSFRASNSFSGTVDIPFEGRSANGATFYGVITIGTSGSGNSTTRGNIRYNADAKNAAVFNRDDFDDLSVWETDRDVSSVRFTLPSSSQGTLYRGYRSSSSLGTKLTSTTSINANDLDRVAFVPAAGYTGTVYIDFTATAASSGGSFTGTVEVDVGLPPADATARYSTRTDPVRLYASDLARNGYTLNTVQFNALPSAVEGYLYYQYTSPVHYGQQAGTGVVYRTSGSNLISDLCFVPRAGYTGTVTIPYTGTNSNGSTFAGEVVITVLPNYSSSHFSDMSGYSSSQQAAVDFLYDHNITYGLTAGQYGPESSIRRGDFAQMLYQAFELTPTSASGAFTDVPSSAYYATAVNTLSARGIVSGIGGGLYAPNSTLTRQDAICMVQRAMKALGWNASDGYANALSGYGDGSRVSGYAQGAMAFAVQRGYLPTNGGYLNPTQPLSRVDMAEILHRVLTY